MSKRTAGALPLLVRLEPDADRPLNQQLYQGLRTLILEGRVRAGMLLPSTRMLSVDLMVSRNTVLNAYEQLTAEGYLEGRAGGGTRVSSTLPDTILRASVPPERRTPIRARRRPSRRAASIAAVPIWPRFSQLPRLTRAFRLGACALGDFPMELWGRLMRRRWSQSGVRALDYGDVSGYAPLREAIAAYLQASRGVICQASQVLIVNGSQQALDLVTRALMDPGDSAWLEDPGYDGAYGALVAGGARVVPVPVDSEGLNVEIGVQRSPNARLAYVTPSHQFPLGLTMSLPRRIELLRWAKTSGAWVLEDDYDSEFRYASRPLAALQGLDAEACVTTPEHSAKSSFRLFDWVTSSYHRHWLRRSSSSASSRTCTRQPSCKPCSQTSSPTGISSDTSDACGCSIASARRHSSLPPDRISTAFWTYGLRMAVCTCSAGCQPESTTAMRRAIQLSKAWTSCHFRALRVRVWIRAPYFLATRDSRQRKSRTARGGWARYWNRCIERHDRAAALEDPTSRRFQIREGK
jgi:DNA-binding transcriptional MocR family regulator